MISYRNFFFFLALLAILLLAFNTVFTSSWRKDRIAFQEAINEFKRPAEIELIILEADECPDCFDVSFLTESLRSSFSIIPVKEERFVSGSKTGKELIGRYTPARLPAVFITGEVEKLLEQVPPLNDLGNLYDNVFIVENLPPPYFETDSWQVRGRYTLTYLTDQSCDDCYDTSIYREILDPFLSIPFEERYVDRSDSEGRDIIDNYGIEKVPTIILSGDLEVYEALNEVWKNVGTVEDGGLYLLRTVEMMGNYYNLKTGKVEDQGI